MTPRTEKASGCPFCAIARGDDQSVEIICADTGWVAFFPPEPATPGHTLIIPRTHVANLWNAGPTLAGELIRAVLRVGHAVDEAARPEGMNLITSAGHVAEQTVLHLHLHVVPRWSDDRFGPIWPSDSGEYEPAELRGLRDRIRAACADDSDP